MSSEAGAHCAESHADLLNAALGYARRGWPVFPLHTPVLFGPKKWGADDHATCTCARPDCEHQGKHPRTHNGLLDASTDPAVVTSWWTRWPDANIGMRTGVAFDVLDLDGSQALDALDALAPPGAGPLTGPLVRTGVGVHIYMERSGVGNRTRMGGRDGIDWRGVGGYVVAPPSLHYLYGDRYEWSEEFGPDSPPAAPPEWLDDLVHKRTPRQPVPASHVPPRSSGSPRGQRTLESEIAKLALAPEGGRNDTLNRAGFVLGQLVAAGELDARCVATDLMAVATRIGLTEHEAVATIRSGMSAGMVRRRSAWAAQ